MYVSPHLHELFHQMGKYKKSDSFLFQDELMIGTDADKDTQTDTCDYTACNGFTFKLDIFDKVETYGQCQFPAGENGSEDDYFCFVNKDSACKDKVI